MQKILFGQSIETLACRFLEQQGLSLVERNFYCRLGEIDLIMLDNTCQSLVFVEVRFRAHAFHGNPTESVDWKKQRKLKRTALHYLQKHNDVRQTARIDVIGVSLITGNGKSNALPFSIDGVSTHQLGPYQLVWTQNAVSN